MKKKLLCIVLALTMLIMPACAKKSARTPKMAESYAAAASAKAAANETKVAATKASSEPETATLEKAEEKEPVQKKAPGTIAEMSVGDTLYGFTLDDVFHIEQFSGDQYTFHHEHSGAELVWIKNEDEYLSFDIAYGTPNLDETDTNHIFEHAIIASSGKYPSKDLYFDMNSKCYRTFLNASTYEHMTTFPASSTSQEQLLKMMDAYLSCMVDPSIISDENFYKREALRYCLYDRDSEIELMGTVFSEDFSELTDTYREHFNDILDALYPGEYASNSNAKLHLNYKDASYEKAVESYERFYHFDNSIILLYGKLDCESILEFLDSEYLSKEKRHGTDLSEYKDPKTTAGFVDSTVECPAYKGDDTKSASYISYSFDTSGMEPEFVQYLDIFAAIENSEYSVFNECLREAGLNNPAASFNNTYTPKTYMTFILANAEPKQKEAFYKAVQKALKIIQKDGEDPEIVETVLGTTVMENLLSTEFRDVEFTVFPQIANYWFLSGKPDFYRVWESALDDMNKNSDEIIKKAAESILSAERSALVTTVPKAGLAEKKEAEISSYLKELKKGMSGKEIDRMISDTLAFDEWNASELVNNDVAISISDIPEVKAAPTHKVQKLDGFDYYAVPTESDSAAMYEIWLDTSALDNEEASYLLSYLSLLHYMGTKERTPQETSLLKTRYLYKLGYSPEYSFNENGQNIPQIRFVWYGTDETFEDGFKLLTEMLKSEDFTDADLLTRSIEELRESFNFAKADGHEISDLLAQRGVAALADTCNYQLSLNGAQYDFLSGLLKKLKKNPKYAEELDNKLHEVMDKVLVKGNVIAAVIGPEEAGKAAAPILEKEISSWPQQTVSEPLYKLPDIKLKTAAIIDESLNYFSAFKEIEDMPGRYAPFVKWMSDRYITQKGRFENGAYTAEAHMLNYYKPTIYVMTYADPNCGVTLDLLENASGFFSENGLSQEDLDGYTLNVISDYTYPQGILSAAQDSLTKQLCGVDPEKWAEYINDIRNAKVSDKNAAGEMIGEELKSATVGMAGNRNIITKDKKRFDEIISFKK